MPRKLKRDPLWNEILESGIFEDPALFHDGANWCVSFVDNKHSTFGRSFTTIGRNLKQASAWIQRYKKLGVTYP